MKNVLLLLFALAALLLAGCTQYHVKRADGTELSVTSMREFPDGITIEYTSPQGASLKVDAGSVRNKPSPLEEFAAQLLARYVQVPAPAPLPAPAPTPAPEE